MLSLKHGRVMYLGQERDKRVNKGRSKTRVAFFFFFLPQQTFALGYLCGTVDKSPYLQMFPFMSVVVVGTKDADMPSNSRYIIEWLN